MFEAKVQFKKEDAAKKVIRHLRSKNFLSRTRFSLVKVPNFDGPGYCVVANCETKEHQTYAQFFMKGALWAIENKERM